MKKKNFTLTMLVFLSLFLSAGKNLQDKPFYCYGGERIYLEVDYARISIVSEEKFKAGDAIKLTNVPDFSIRNGEKDHTRQNIVLFEENAKKTQGEEIFITEIEFSKNLKQADYQDIIQHLSKEEHLVRVMPAYIVSGQKLGISHNFYVKLFKEEDRTKLFELAKKHAVQVLGYNEFMPLWFTLSCGRESFLNSIEAANLFFETGLFECAEPEFLHRNLQLSNDPYFPNQWGLKNTGQYCNSSNIDIRAEGAWSITTGSPNIRVAVFDAGFTPNHPDLVNNMYGTGYDAESGTTPSVPNGYNPHGISCAGVIAAEQNNSLGTSGVAPNTKLIPVSINLNRLTTTPQQLANGINWAWQNGADVINNSWGGFTPSGIVDNAITNALSQGRNGKGTIVLFATGNSNSAGIGYPGNSNPDILAVGAIAPDGKRVDSVSCDGVNGWGSNYGNQLDIVAPGVRVPTIGGMFRYGHWGYTQSFLGTSAACPHVAGVAALVLSVNSELTGQQVRDIIESTAQKVGGYNYQTAPGHTNGTWHQEMGYGLVDAHAAVLAACATIPVNFANQIVTSDTTITGCTINVQNVKVQNGAKLTLNAKGEVNIGSGFEVELGSEFEIVK